MNEYQLEVKTTSTVHIEAHSYEEAEAILEQSFDKTAPTLIIDGEDVLFDFAITSIRELNK